MMRPRTIRIVAVVLALIVGLVCVLGYNFVFDKNIRPRENTLDY
jgi:Tfp pilus assembly protein PilO